MLGLTFSSKLNWWSYIICIGKTTSKKIGAVIRSVKFLSPKVALYLYKSTICSCVKRCCYFWAGAPSCFLEMLDKLQKLVCRIVGHSLASSLEPLAHCQNAGSLSHFYRYYFCYFGSTFFLLREVNSYYFNRLHVFSVAIPICCNDVYFDSFFPHAPRLYVLSKDISCILYALIFLCFFFLYLHALQWLFSFAWSESQLKKNWLPSSQRILHCKKVWNTILR